MSKKKKGKRIKVEVPTHVTGILKFAQGALCTMVTSFDIWAHELPWIEIHGTDGSLCIPDPNGFNGPVRIRRAREDSWQEVQMTHGYRDNNRGLIMLVPNKEVQTKYPHSRIILSLL